MQSTTNSDLFFDVAVVGLGPVGATLTALLAARNIRVLAVDAADDVFNLPRAVGLDHEVMRVFQELGIAEQLATITSPYRPSEYRSAQGELLRRLDSQPAPYPLGWPPYLTFLQPDLERAVRGVIEKSAYVDMRTSVEVTGLEETQSHANLILRDANSADIRTASAKYVVGCDGGNSFIRQHLDIKFEDLVFDEPWVVVDVLLEEDVPLPDVNVQFCDPARPHTFVVCPGNLRRWEFMLLPGEDPAAMSRDEAVWELLSPWVKPGQARIWRAAAYRFHALVATAWKKGRFMLAGDACHMTPPFLAQGMVQGIKDASNLAWKLAAVLEGAPETLLDTYEMERRPLVRKVISITKDLGNIICERDPVRAEERNRRMRAEILAGKGRFVRQDMFPPIAESPICFHCDDTKNASGRPAPQPEITDDQGHTRRLDDVAGASFHLFTLPGFELDDVTEARLHALGIGCSVIATSDQVGDYKEKDSVFRDWMSEHGCTAILVRPDHVVVSGLNTLDTLNAVLDSLSPALQAA